MGYREQIEWMASENAELRKLLDKATDSLGTVTNELMRTSADLAALRILLDHQTDRLKLQPKKNP